jgi:hypothetical protein
MKLTLDFIVIGAQKAGTTSLFEYIKGHPDLHFPHDKERPFFSHEKAVQRGWDEYMVRNFGNASPEKRWGTVTPHYLAGNVVEDDNSPASAQVTPFRDEAPERIVPLRIRDQLPDVKLSALLRDPVRRLVSQFRMNVLWGWEHRPFAQLVDEILEPSAVAAARERFSPLTSYIPYGEYGRLLEPYFEIFGRERILVQFSADLESRPLDTVQELLRHIGVDDTYVPQNVGKRYHQASGSRRVGWLDAAALQRALADRPALKRAWHGLPGGLRGRLDRGFGRAQLRLHLWNRTSRETPPAPVDADSLSRLADFYESDRRRLETLLGHAVPWGQPVARAS